MKYTIKGATLIEVVVFLVVLGLVAAIFISFNAVFNYLGFLNSSTTGLELAQQRMELIIRNPNIRLPVPTGNINNLTDVCAGTSPPPACDYSLMNGYNVNATISSDCSGETSFVNINGTSIFTPSGDCRLVVVTVTKTNGAVAARLSTAITNYSY